MDYYGMYMCELYDEEGNLRIGYGQTGKHSFPDVIEAESEDEALKEFESWLANTEGMLNDDYGAPDVVDGVLIYKHPDGTTAARVYVTNDECI